MAAEPEDEAQLEVSGAENEVNYEGSWADKDEDGKYKYADFSPFLNNGKLIISGEISIHTAEQLAGLMVIVNADTNTTIEDKDHRSIQIGNTQVSFGGCIINLKGTIDLDAHEWVPIGKDSSHPFNATFVGSTGEGDICEIRGVQIYSYYQYVGLIGYYTGFNVANIGIGENSGMDISIEWYNDVRVGGIIGQVDKNSVVLSNCYNMGNITGYVYKGNVFAGGIVGHAESSVTLDNCYNTGNISGSEGYDTNVHTGGIIGHAQAFATLNNCYNTGNINGRGVFSINVCTGGIIGYTQASAEINNCYNTGNISVSGLDGPNRYIGGLIGYTWSNATLNNCYNTANISCSFNGRNDIKEREPKKGNVHYGGIIGHAESNATLNNCYYFTNTTDWGVGNKADEESGAINLLKDAQTESVELRPNDIKTIPNTEANTKLREVNTTEGASQKLGAGFKMEYVYDTPENVTTGLQNNKNELQIAAREGAKSGKVTLTGIKVTQNGLTANGYTGAPSTFKIDVNKGTSFDLRVKYTLSFEPNGGEWVGTQPKRIEYTQGEGSDVALPTSEKIKRDGYTFVGWNTQKDGSGEYIKKIDKNLAISKLYAQFD